MDFILFYFFPKKTPSISYNEIEFNFTSLKIQNDKNNEEEEASNKIKTYLSP